MDVKGCVRSWLFLVEVLQVLIYGFDTFKSKGSTPIGGHSYTPGPTPVTDQLVQPQPGQVHVRGTLGGVKVVQQVGNAIQHVRRQATCVIAFPESPQGVIPEAHYLCIVPCIGALASPTEVRR